MLSPRCKKPGVQTFTDPMNPFARNTSKAMTNLQEARADPARAGARTRNPGMIPAAEGSDRLGFSVYRYGHHVYRPQKRISDVFPGSPSSTMVTPAPSPRNVPSPRSSQGATEALRSGKPITATTALENYLNDMKRCSTSLRNVPPTPSADLQRMNNELTFLPSERGKGDALKRRSRSLSVDRSMHEESSSSDAYGFARKRPVSGALGAANRSHRDMLYHLEQPEVQAPRTPRTPRVVQDDKRFQEVVAYMKETKPELARCFSEYKARNRDSTGLLYSSPVLA